MKVLFLHNNEPDYLSDSLFHGLRQLLGGNCVDVPRSDSMYAPLTSGIRSKLRGNGFTLYGMLNDSPELIDARYFWQKDLATYDLVVIANIWTLWEKAWELSRNLDTAKLAVLDGIDAPDIFPYAGRLRSSPWAFFAPVKKWGYFKRELIGEGHNYSLEHRLPAAILRHLPLPNNVKPISFSIPEEKVWRGEEVPKTQDFPRHIVDPDVATQLPGAFYSKTGSDQHTFSSEDEYFADLRCSRFGITTKRSGWDCLRHYELAANGCVLCFRDLDSKPDTCAPHGLNESNTIIYHNYAELRERLYSITEQQYRDLRTNTEEWVIRNTTLHRAGEFLSACLKQERPDC